MKQITGNLIWKSKVVTQKTYFGTPYTKKKKKMTINITATKNKEKRVFFSFLFCITNWNKIISGEHISIATLYT